MSKLEPRSAVQKECCGKKVKAIYTRKRWEQQDGRIHLIALPIVPNNRRVVFISNDCRILAGNRFFSHRINESPVDRDMQEN
jgi:hypothetical protein